MSPGEYRKSAEKSAEKVANEDEIGKQEIISFIENESKQQEKGKTSQLLVEVDASNYKKKYVDETRVINIGSIYMLLQHLL